MFLTYVLLFVVFSTYIFYNHLPCLILLYYNYLLCLIILCYNYLPCLILLYCNYLLCLILRVYTITILTFANHLKSALKNSAFQST